MPRSNIVVYPYKATSESALRLVRNLEAILDQEVLLLHLHSKHKVLPTDFIVGWGAGNVPDWLPPGTKHKFLGYLNGYKDICNSVDKRISFKNFVDNGVPIPEYTIKTAEANEWLANGEVVLSRMEVEGMRGAGIEINHPDVVDEVWNAPLYTKFIRKEREIRLHVFNGKVIFGQEKTLKKKSSVIKNLVLRDNSSWTFEWLGPRDRAALGPTVSAAAVKAIEANGLDFGAIDILFDKNKRAYVLETNTCPELGSDGAALYARGIIDAERKARG
jgi:hypothetical protein